MTYKIPHLESLIIVEKCQLFVRNKKMHKKRPFRSGKIALILLFLEKKVKKIIEKCFIQSLRKTPFRQVQKQNF